MQDDTLTLRIPSELKARLQMRAKQEQRSVTQIVVRTLEQASKRWQNGAKSEADH